MEITATTLTQLRADKTYYLSNTTGTIKETGFWQWFKCVTGLGDGREKARRLAEAVKTALLADASIKSETKLSSELDGLDKTYSLSGASLRQIATRFKADHAQAIATSDACRLAEEIADTQVKTWAEQGSVLPEPESLGYVKKLAVYSAQQVLENAFDLNNDPKELARRVRRSMDQFIIAITSVENMPLRYVRYPRASKYTTPDGSSRTLNVPRFRLDELHFRVFLAAMGSKDGTSMLERFSRAVLRLPEEEIQKRKEVLRDLPLASAKKSGSVAAFAEQMAKSHERYNSSVLSGVNTGSSHFAPAAFVEAENEVIVEMRERFGEKAIRKSSSAFSLISAKDHLAAITPLVAQANAEGRTIGTEEIKNAIRGLCLKGAAISVLASEFTDIAKERNLGESNYSLALAFATAHPELMDEISACETPEAARAAIRRHEDAIVAKLQLDVDATREAASLPGKAVEAIATASGLDVEYVRARLNVDRLRDKASEVMRKITTGAFEGVDKSGFDVAAAFRGVLDNFVKGRLAVLKEVDEIEGLSDGLRRKWKNHVLSTYKPESLHPARIHELVEGGQFDDKLLEEALDAEGTGPAALKICTYMGRLNAHFVELFGEEEWEDMGNDEREPVLNLALLAVIDRNPALAEKFLARSEELMSAANNEFNQDDYMAHGHGRKVVEGLYTILVGIDGRKVGE